MADTAANNGNQRVTNAVLALKIDQLDETVRAYVVADNRRYEAHEVRLRYVETTQGKIKERLTIFAVGQAILSAALATVAGWIGARN